MLEKKSNGVHFRWAAIAAVIGILGLVIGNVLNPLNMKIEANRGDIVELDKSVKQSISAASIDRQMIKGDVAVLNTQYENIVKRQDEMLQNQKEMKTEFNGKMDQIIREIRGR